MTSSSSGPHSQEGVKQMSYVQLSHLSASPTADTISHPVVFTVLTQGGYNTQLGFPWLPESQPLSAILETTASHLSLGRERIKVISLLAYMNDV